MIINKVEITKFRGFDKIEIELGNQLTVIAGQNGTQKTTVLGMLTQPFTITDKGNPMFAEKPLCGGSFKSDFQQKFKLSKNFDKAKAHEWTLHLNNVADPFTIESIPRGTNNIRFWQKGTRAKGSGYIQLPVIYLSLNRLIPIGEDVRLKKSAKVTLSAAEERFYKDWHNQILISLDELKNANYLESPVKNTLGVNTELYDWEQNSAGQDNIGKILLAIMSFKRLKETHKADYKGGILAIDELDATLYPGSQIKLITALRKFASDYNIQIIFTTHSLSILDFACKLQESNKLKPETKNQIKVLFFEKLNNKIKPIQDVNFSTITHRLNVTKEDKKNSKINVFTEDKEGAILTKALLGRMTSRLNFINCSFGHSNIIELIKSKIPAFTFPNSITILDGDVSGNVSVMRKIKGIKNIVLLPSSKSPEQLLAGFLFDLDDESPVWKSINFNFNKQFCFKDYTLSEIHNDREKAKRWFNSHIKDWGKNGAKVISPWKKANHVEAANFISDFVKTYNAFAKELSIEEI